jgi:hypothetical protein
MAGPALPILALGCKASMTEAESARPNPLAKGVTELGETAGRGASPAKI